MANGSKMSQRVAANVTPAQRKMMRDVAKGVFDSRVEHKVTTVTNAAVTSALAGAVQPITRFVIEADGENERTGTTILVQRLHMKVGFHNTVGALFQSTQRIIVFSDTMCNGAAPAVTDVLETASVYAGYNQINSQRNRFKIYVDKLYDQVSTVHTGLMHLDQTFQINKKVYYNNASGATSDGKNSLFYLVISSAVSGASVFYIAGFRLQFTDA